MRPLPWILGRDLPPPEHRLTRRLFLALFGLVHLAAFVSLWTQVEGLVGSNGILPARELVEWAHEQLGDGGFWGMPTLCWWGASDTLLHGLCAAGVALSIAVVVGVAPRWALLLLWADYLSLVNVGDVFLSYQWDVLLLEATLPAALWAPAALRPRWGAGPPHSWIARWLLIWLLFRVMFLSGAVKLVSGDPTWSNLTALEYHYWSQPLPHALSHYVHHAPVWFHRAGVVGMFAMELGLPWLLFGPRRLRYVGAAGIVGLMVMIMATGNYGFFEPLVLVLCVTALDDAALRRLLPRRWRREPAAAEPPSPYQVHPLRPALLASFALVSLTLTGAAGLSRLRLGGHLPGPLGALRAWAAPLRSFNAYGLFAVMTTERPEIAVEGSLDGLEWKPYRFRYKPGDPGRRPRWAGVHMPRLDWQMWFAALRGWRGARWYPAFVRRLLESSPEVLGLLAEDPFDGSPPLYVRSTVAPYTFSSPVERRGGVWWSRQRGSSYCPTYQLVDGRLRAIPVGMVR